MKTFYPLLFSTLFTINLWGQNPPNFLFNDVSTIICPFDSTQTIIQPNYWLIYQTQNGKWNGEIDSTHCISVEEVSNDLEIDLNQIDPAKPLFIKSLMNDNNKVFLEPNSLHNSSFFIRKSEGAMLNINEDCENGICSGLIVGVEIPDSTGTEKTLRVHHSTATQFPSKASAEFCYATEKFNENYLKEFILKITFINQDLEGEWLRLRYVSNEEFIAEWEDYRIYDMPIPESLFDGTHYNASLYDFSIIYDGNALMMYTDTTYPSPEHLSYVEAHLLSNKPTQETINFFINNYETLIYQPYTQLRGGLVEGNDTLRHVVNIINNGGTICMYNFAEFNFDGSSHYIHQGGQVEFHGTTSCMMFKNGGTLNVAENTSFQYGNGGEGILAICVGSTINIAKGGTLEIDNHMVLHSCGEQGNRQIFMELNPGSTLRFGENARLSNISANPEMQLNIYMNGGILDDHLLSETERQLINRIYPEPDEQNNFMLSPNPAADFCTASMVMKEKGELTFKVFDLNGRLVQSYKKVLEKGYNEFELDLSRLQGGMYLLMLESHELNTCRKLLKL